MLAGSLIAVSKGWQEGGWSALAGSISARATTYDAGRERKRGQFLLPRARLGGKVSFLALLLAVIVAVIMVMIVNVMVVPVIVIMMIVVVVIMIVMMTAGVVRIGVKLLGADRLLRHVGKLGDEIDHLVLEQRRPDLGQSLGIVAVEVVDLALLARELSDPLE